MRRASSSRRLVPRPRLRCREVAPEGLLIQAEPRRQPGDGPSSIATPSTKISLLQQATAGHQRALPVGRQAGQRQPGGVDPEGDGLAERDAVVVPPSTWRRIRGSPNRTGPRAARRGTDCRRGGPSGRRWRSASRRSGSRGSSRCARPGSPPGRSSGCPARDRNRACAINADCGANPPRPSTSGIAGRGRRSWQRPSAPC